jgi:ABC-type nitrate/sulfonate/bicarbonate transport system permease component
VLAGLWAVLQSGEVWCTPAALYRIVIGFGAAVLLSLGVGLAAFVSRAAAAWCMISACHLNSTSVFVWIVISLIWFGLSNWAPSLPPS